MTVPGARGTLHAVLPGIVEDAARPSGGSVYDDRVCRGLATRGWEVRRHVVRGSWPRPGSDDRSALSEVLWSLPAGALTLLDGLVASAVPELLAEHASRLRLVVVLHLPAADEPGLDDAREVAARERAALRAARVVVVPSGAVGRRVVGDPRLAGTAVYVVPPGVDHAPVTVATPGGTRLACVASVTPRKGQDVLVEALSRLTDLPWTLVCAGPDDGQDGYAHLIRGRIGAAGLTDRVRMLGAISAEAVAEVYAAADLLVLPSRAEPYGMVVTEALARGVPVVGSAVDGLPEALGRAPFGELPGLLVSPGDPVGLADALRRWLTEPLLRRRLRAAAVARRATLSGWDATAAALEAALERARDAA